MLKYVKEGKISLEMVAEKMSHAVATCFQVKERGFIREDYYADLVIVDIEGETRVSKESILYKCGWSPFEGSTFPSAVTHCFVNGEMVYGNNAWNESYKGMRLQFNR